MLRIRTGYSFHHAFGSADAVAKAAKEAGHKWIAMADRNSTFGFYPMMKACKKVGIELKLGVELAVSRDLSVKRPNLEWWGFFPTSSVVPMHELIALATERCGVAALPIEAVLKAKGLVKICGINSDPSISAKHDVLFPLSGSLPIPAYLAAKKAKAKFIAVSDNLYPSKEDEAAYLIALGRRASTQTYPQHILSKEDHAKSLAFADASDRSSAYKRAMALEKSLTAKLTPGELIIPEKKKTLKKMCEEGAKKLGVNLANKVYKERLARELKLIADKKFEDYFYIIADIVTFAKQHMIVGPARGSSCGSLVCYLLGITTIDPIPYGLIFERFIDINRSDLPDIDIDFSDTKREIVFDYVREKYGDDHVARLGSVGMFKPRSAVKATADAFRIPDVRVDQFLDVIIKRSSGDARAMDAIEDSLAATDTGKAFEADYPEIRIATKLEGTPHNAGQHAAGIVITKRPVVETVAINSRNGAAMCDKKAAEDLNLLKIDALGLTQLSIFERCLELCGLPPTTETLNKIPLNDPLAFAVLNANRYSGVFQFEGSALQQTAKNITITELEDIIAVTALSRPGPISTGGATEWIQRHNKEKPTTYPHPLFEPHLKTTLGVVAYQEQVMSIGREIGGLSWEDVTALRKAMSRSLGKEFFNQYGDRWKSGAKKKGIPDAVAEKVWDDLCAYGAWAFNRSHSVAYGIVSYYSAYLKAHHPVEYAAAVLDAQSEPRRQIEMLREMQAIGVGYIPVDPKLSSDRWEPKKIKGKMTLVGPFHQVKGIGKATTREIIEARENGEEIRESVAKKLRNAKTDVDSLTPIYDRVHKLWPDLSEAGIQSTPIFCEDVRSDRRETVLLIAVAERVQPRDDNDLQKVAKRGYKVSGNSMALNIFVRDDTGECFCRISRHNFKQLSSRVLEAGKPGNIIFAIKGETTVGFRMVNVLNIKFLGTLHD